MTYRNETIVLLNANKFSKTKQNTHCTVLPAKSDGDVMFCLQCYGDLESIYHLWFNRIRRIGLKHE